MRELAWRMSLALVLWVGGFVLPLAIPLVTGLPLPLATKTALSALLVFGLPQLLTVIAIAIVGKSGFRYLKEQLFGAAKRLGPPVHVSRIRYRVGLVMLVLGGEFWDKVKALFLCEARAVLPAMSGPRVANGTVAET